MSDPDSEAGEERKELQVAEQATGSRLDQWLAAELGPELSRSRAKALILAGKVITADGEVVTEPKRRLTAGDRFIIRMPEPQSGEPQGEPIPLDILYEDDSILVINKPAGLVVHPGPGNWTGTLVNALLYHCGNSLSRIGGVHRPGIVHRLDRETSGVMVVAKTDQAHRFLAEAFADHGRDGELERIYWGLVWGAPKRRVGVIDAPLGRAPQDRTLRAVVPEDRIDARRAVTHYRVLQYYGQHNTKGAIISLVECQLETGRTHQIRVHLAHIGHPVVGDPSYGRSYRTKARLLPDTLAEKFARFSRQALHARLLAFRHPQSGEWMRFEAPLPDDFAELLASLERLTT